MLKINDILSQESEKFYKTNSVAREKNKYKCLGRFSAGFRECEVTVFEI